MIFLIYIFSSSLFLVLMFFYCSGHPFFPYSCLGYAQMLSFSLFFVARGIPFSLISTLSMPGHSYFLYFLLLEAFFFPLFLLWVCPGTLIFLVFCCSWHTCFSYSCFRYARALSFSLFFVARGIPFSFILALGMPRHSHFPCFLLLGAYLFLSFLL